MPHRRLALINSLLSPSVFLPIFKPAKFKVCALIPFFISHLYRCFIFVVTLVDLGFSSHAFHSSARLVFMNAQLSDDRKSLTITSPPNRNIYPPGPAFVFLTIDDVSSEGTRVMVGSGAPPPQTD